MSEILCCHNVNCLGLFILIVIVGIVLYWSHKEINGRDR